MPQTPDPNRQEKFVEKAVNFGKGFSLSGIVCQPVANNNKTSALVILNSGRMHRVGAGRFSVSLARKAAQSGFLSLRFDQSGIGDSVPREVSVSDEARILEEISAALDFIEERFNVSRFTLYGLCSGAQYSFLYSVNDDRITGLVGIDNWVYPTAGFYLRHYGPRLFKPGPWIRSFKKSVRKIWGTVDDTDTKKQIELSIWQPKPPRHFMESGFQALVNNGVRLHYIYTGSELYNYSGQMVDMFSKVSFGNALTVYYFPRATHTLQEPRLQQQVLRNIVSWMSQG